VKVKGLSEGLNVQQLTYEVPYNAYELSSVSKADETKEGHRCTSQHGRTETFATPECEIKKQYLDSRY
jgi:hypothetical protein